MHGQGMTGLALIAKGLNLRCSLWITDELDNAQTNAGLHFITAQSRAVLIMARTASILASNAAVST